MASAEQQYADLVAKTRAFVEAEIRPRARAIDAGGEGLPRDLIEKMAAQGWLGATFPRDRGGMGLDPVAYGLLTEAIGTVCSNSRALLTLQVSLVGESLLKWGTPEQVATWIPRLASGDVLYAFALSEPEVGTDARSVGTIYRKDGDSFVIKGHKKWMTFGALADLYLVFARENETITAFLVERRAPGVSVKPMTGLLGLRGGHLGEILFDDVVVPASHVVGGIGNGFRYVANWALDHGRYSIAWAGQALARACVESMASYARRRSQFGKKLLEFPQVQAILGDATAKMCAGRALCMRVGELRKADAPDAMIETSIAKYFTSTMANDIAREAIQVHGGNGCSDAYPVERYFREAKILEIIEGTSQVQQQIIAKHALQKYNLASYGAADS